MPDVVYIDSGTDTPVSTDFVDFGGINQHVQRIKLVDGTDGSNSLISGDSTYGLDVDITRLPSVTLSSQSSPFTDALIITGDINVMKDSIYGLDVKVTDSIALTLASQNSPFNTDINITGNVRLLKDSVYGVDVKVTDIPSITLSNQVSPFTEAIDVSGDINLQDGLGNDITSTNSALDINLKYSNTTLDVSGSNLVVTGNVNIMKDSIYGVDVNVTDIIDITLASQPSPFTTDVNITGNVRLLKDSVYGVDTNVTNIPAVTLASQENPFIEDINITGNVRLLKDSVYGVDVKVTDITDITLASQSNPFTEAISVDITPLSSCGSGKTTVTTAGVRVALSSSTPISSVTIKACIANTGIIYIGNSTVTSSNGFELSAGDTISLDIDNLSDVYIDSSVNTQSVTYMWVA